MKLTKDTKRKPKVSTLIAFGLAGAPQAVDLSGPVDLWTSGPGPILAEKRENADAAPASVPRRNVGLFWSTPLVKYLRLTLACACANTNKISVNFFNPTRTHTIRPFVHLPVCPTGRPSYIYFLFICCCCCRALDCNGFVGMKIFLYYYYSFFYFFCRILCLAVAYLKQFGGGTFLVPANSQEPTAGGIT